MILLIGTMFPIERFPQYLRPIIKCTPIYVVTYGPAKLLINVSLQNFVQILLAQIIYLFVATTLTLILYEKGVKKLNVNGG